MAGAGNGLLHTCHADVGD